MAGMSSSVSWEHPLRNCIGKEIFKNARQKLASGDFRYTLAEASTIKSQNYHRLIQSIEALFEMFEKQRHHKVCLDPSITALCWNGKIRWGSRAKRVMFQWSAADAQPSFNRFLLERGIRIQNLGQEKEIEKVIKIYNAEVDKQIELLFRGILSPIK